MIDRRQILAALAALAAGAGSEVRAETLTGVDPAAAGRIGRAYLAAHPRAGDAHRLAADLLPDGWSPAALHRLRGRVAQDFRRGRLFVHRGWRLSETEGRLFALLVA
jgi:hypothetical protein